MITGKLYDRLKFIAQILLPALGTLYFTLAAIWNLPAAEQVVGTIVAVDTFLGVILGISQAKYGQKVAKGAMHATLNEAGHLSYSLEFDEDPEMLTSKKELRLEMKKPTASAV